MSQRYCDVSSPFNTREFYDSYECVYTKKRLEKSSKQFKNAEGEVEDITNCCLLMQFYVLYGNQVNKYKSVTLNSLNNMLAMRKWKFFFFRNCIPIQIQQKITIRTLYSSITDTDWLIESGQVRRRSPIYFPFFNHNLEHLRNPCNRFSRIYVEFSEKKWCSPKFHTYQQSCTLYIHANHVYPLSSTENITSIILIMKSSYCRIFTHLLLYDASILAIYLLHHH